MQMTEISDPLFLLGELAVLLFACIALYTTFAIMRSYKGSTLGVTFGYYFYGVSLLLAIRVLIFLVNQHVIKVADDTLMIQWHIIFYLGMTMFFLAAKQMIHLAQIAESAISFRGVHILGVFLLGASFLTTVLLIPFDYQISTYFNNSIWDHIGILHFIAFVFTLVIISYLIKIRAQYKNIGVIAVPIIIVLSVLSTIHLWELSTESWKLIQISADMGETIELFLWFPVFPILIISFLRLHKLMQIA